MTPTTLAGLRAGGSPQYEQGIIRLLRHKKAPATIFVTGLWAKAYPEAVKEFTRDPLFEVETTPTTTAPGPPTATASPP